MDLPDPLTGASTFKYHARVRAAGELARPEGEGGSLSEGSDAAREGEGIERGFPEWIRALPRFEGPFEAFRLAASGCAVLFGTYSPDLEIAPHDHETDNCGVVLSGEMVLEIEGEERRYGPGDWYVIPAGTRHAARFEVQTSDIEFWFECP